MEHKPLQWHPAFQAVLQIELEGEKEYLQFHEEFNLTKKPLQIDTLIIKESNRKITKSIGRIFSRYNIVEYKNPGASFGINDFFKVNGYACLYQAAGREPKIQPSEITVTLVVNQYPDKLITFLRKTYGSDITEKFPGIYYISKLLFKFQLLIIHQLSPVETIWLSRLRSDLKIGEDIEPLAKAYKGKENTPVYEAAMDLIIRANWKKYKEGCNLCNALEELFADKLEQREHLGIEKGIEKGIERSIIELLSELGPVPDALHDRIHLQKDVNILTAWLKLAARSKSISDFQKNTDNPVS